MSAARLTTPKATTARHGLQVAATRSVWQGLSGYFVLTTSMTNQRVALPGMFSPLPSAPYA